MFPEPSALERIAAERASQTSPHASEAESFLTQARHQRAANTVGGGHFPMVGSPSSPAPDCHQFGKEYEDSWTWGDWILIGVIASGIAFWVLAGAFFLDWAT